MMQTVKRELCYTSALEHQLANHIRGLQQPAIKLRLLIALHKQPECRNVPDKPSIGCNMQSAVT